MNKIYEYHITHSYTMVEDGMKIIGTTQLYKVGIYFVATSDMYPNDRIQLNLKPKDIVKIEKDINKSLAKGLIKDLEWGRVIKVTTEDGLLKEVL